MNTIMVEAVLYDMLSWMSPSYPIGAFAHSSGLEWAVEKGHVVDRASAFGWIADAVEYGAIRTDALLFVHAHRATGEGNSRRLAEIAELAAAALTSHERRLEATAQGAAFRRIARTTSPTPVLDMLDAIEDEDLSYPVVVACLTAGHEVPLRPALTAFLHGVAANLVSAAQRLVPLGQTDGQHVMRDLRNTLFSAVEAAATPADGDLFDQMGSAGLYADLACMAHETQYTRLFRT